MSPSSHLTFSSKSYHFLNYLFSACPIFPQYWHVFLFRLCWGASTYLWGFWSQYAGFWVEASNHTLSLGSIFTSPLSNWAWCLLPRFPSLSSLCWSIIKKTIESFKGVILTIFLVWFPFGVEIQHENVKWCSQVHQDQLYELSILVMIVISTLSQFQLEFFDMHQIVLNYVKRMKIERDKLFL